MDKMAIVAYIMRIVKNVAPEIAQSVAEYLTNKNQNNYNKMEMYIKLAGHTVEQFFKGLEKNTSDREFIDSFRRTAALGARIEIINNSIQIPDIEKVVLLEKVHEDEKKQQEAALEELRRKMRTYVLVSAGVLGMGMLACKTKSSEFFSIKNSGGLLKTSGAIGLPLIGRLL